MSVLIVNSYFQTSNQTRLITNDFLIFIYVSNYDNSWHRWTDKEAYESDGTLWFIVLCIMWDYDTCNWGL